ncbi:MAG: cupredoxin family copper-binding protein [Proteobacteria bacterium]|nr:cupredoxin family copper-binding protein [Pseudomonadota bacterium]MBS0461011.1 cupredoxin family copper-binding protein [Pseudomonadota bacterium]MBS0464969.1 cupredoxin family copper-binding protein [Pseudomonadota bacterium]
MPTIITKRPRAATVVALSFAAALTFGASAHDVVKASSPTTPAPTQTITIDKFAFTPNEITVAPGTTVVWINKDQTPHTVTARDKSFHSAGMDTGDTYQYTFAKAGDFSYFCSMHPFMTAIVHVRK